MRARRIRAEREDAMMARAAAGSSGRRRPWPAVLAVLLSVGLTLAPATARPAAAATGRLIVTSAATYAVDPAASAVHVSVAATFTNEKPSDARFFYYWRDLTWTVHPEAANLQVRDATGALKITPVAREGFVEAQFRLRRNLLYRQSIGLTITWDLPSGAPRSDSSIRVGAAFVTFDLWAWGDPATSSVTARLPAGYEVETFGSTLEATTLPTGVTLTATAISNTDEFWAAVSAIREASFASADLHLRGGIDLVVRGWPEDAEWRTKVVDTLRQGVPRLGALIGLPWPIDGPVEVTEVYTPLLEGYAGIFYTLEDRIDISEDLDPLVIVHEGSHAWFNDALFRDRWVDEGLADTYAAKVLVEMGEAQQSPDAPVADDDGRIDLIAWGAPGRITDETAAVERYGYNTSWFVVSEIVEEVGIEKMRAVFRAADDNTIAYAGAGPDEPVRATDDWRRFLDLLEEVAGSEKAEPLFREYVVDASGTRDLDARDGARAAYAKLLQTGNGWLPPIYVRGVMGTWSFSKANVRIDEAGQILDLRDDVDAAAEALDLEPGPAFESAYEGASDDFAIAEAAGRAELEALSTLADAHDAVSAQLDVVASIGLLDVKPLDVYAEAAAEYEAGRLEASEAAAAEAVALVADAPRIGRERLAIGGAIGLVVLVLAALLLRRRRRRRVVSLAWAARARSGSPAVPLADATRPVSWSGPYGTLAADSPAPRPPTDGDAGPEGGAADGEGPSAAT
jgi:hypothetical protein